MLVSPTVKLEDLKKTRKSITKVLSEACNNYKLTDYTIDLDKAIRMHNFIEDLREKIHDIDNEIKVCEAKIAKDVEPEYDMVGVKYPRAKRTECSGLADTVEELTKLRDRLVKNLDEAYGSSFKYDYNSWTSQSYIEELNKIHSIDNELARISIDKDSESDGKPIPKKYETQNVIFNADSYELLSNPKENTTYIDTRDGKLRIWNGSEYVDIVPYDKSEYIETLEEKVKSLTKELNEIKEDNSDTIRTDENGCIIW